MATIMYASIHETVEEVWDTTVEAGDSGLFVYRETCIGRERLYTFVQNLAHEHGATFIRWQWQYATGLPTVVTRWSVAGEEETYA